MLWKDIMVLKAVSALEDAHHSQVYNYLHTMYYALIRAICAICATKMTVCGLTNPQSKPRMLWKDNHGTEGGKRP